MTREDALRELELLPVWQLRAPVAKPTSETPAPIPTSAPPMALRMILSDDANYIFLVDALKNQEEETLLQNMLKAMQAKPRVDIGLQGISDLSAHQAKIIIAMGASAAQAIGLQANSGAAPSQVQQTAFGAAIATFSPAHLLQNGADKARAWQDLCLAKSAI